MSYDALNEDSAALRLEFHVIKAVQLRGLPAVLRVAVLAWWNRPRIPYDMPARLRADMGLPPAPKSMFWPEPGDCWPLPIPIWKL
jgi:hypothetical protein